MKHPDYDKLKEIAMQSRWAYVDRIYGGSVNHVMWDEPYPSRNIRTRCGREGVMKAFASSDLWRPGCKECLKRR